VKDRLSELTDEELSELTRHYLERQTKEWKHLKKEFTTEAQMNNPAEIESVVIRLIPKLIEPFSYYAIGVINELELRQEIKRAAQKHLKESWPHLQDVKRLSVALSVLSMYTLTVFMAHGIQSELQRVFNDAIQFAERNQLQPHHIFQDEKIYLNFICKTETPISYRKKLETIFAASSPKRTAFLFRRAKEFLENPQTSAPINSPPSPEEEKARVQCATSFVKQIIAWPEVITQRILEVFYPRH